MAVVVPNFASSTEDRVSGAQLINGSLKFDESIETHFTRTPSSGGNRKTFTVSCWFKKTMTDSSSTRVIMFAGPNGDDTYPLVFNSSQQVQNAHYEGGYTYQVNTNARLQDFSSWYHLVSITDTAAASSSDRIKLYINGELQTSLATASYPSLNYDTSINESGQVQCIGFQHTANSFELDGYLSQFYFIDGQALDASYFGYTDGLTGTWRPKKFNITDAPTADWGTNGFYLPFDGSAPIGQDQSGKGNDWTLVNFSGTHSIEKATGALPTLNTVAGGNIAVPRPRGNAGVAVTVYDDGGGNKYYLDGAKTGSLDFVRGQTVTFNTGDSTVSGHPFRFSPKVNGTHGTTDYSVDFDGNDTLSMATSSDLAFGTGDYTVECWVKPTSVSGNLEIVLNTGGSSATTFFFHYDNNQLSVGTYFAYISNQAATFENGKWYHIVACRSGSTLKLFQNGLQVGFDATDNTNWASGGTIIIGTNSAGSQAVNGLISNLRVVKGTAVYTSNFTPSYEPLTNITNTKLLCCNNSSVTGATVTPGTITAGGDPSSSTDTPYDTYSLGVVTGAISPGTVGAATTITFPHNAPDTLYYYCTNHSGMGGSGTIGLGTDIRKADPYAWKNTLAISGSAIVDDSSKVNCTSTTKALTNNGNTTLSSAKSNFYARSIYFDGTDDDITITATAETNIGVGDFTVEGWVYNTRSQEQSYVTNWNSGGQFQVQMSSGGALQASWAPYSTAVYAITDAQAIVLNQWMHFAYVREGSLFTLYKNGRSVGTQTSINNTTTNNNIILGENGLNQDRDFQGYLQDIRIYKGIAKYTSNFIPASTQPDIIKDSPSGTVYDSELEKSVSGAASTKKEGNQNISVAASSDFAFGTGDFTVEGYFYITDSGSNSNAWDLRDGSDAEQFFLRCINGTSWDLRFSGGQLATFTAEVKIWNHIAVSRSGSTLKIFVNGVQTNSISNSSNATNTGPLLISTFFDTTGSGTDYGFSGLVSNFRVVKGTGLYTQDFVPPTKPLTNVTNTKLLCFNSESSITSATVTPGTITVTGTQTLPSSFSPFDTSIDGVLGKGSDYCILNNNDNGDATLTDAGTYFTANASGGTTGSNVTGTIGMPLNSGKYYWEYDIEGGTNSGVLGIGYGSVAKITALSSFDAALIKIYGYSPNGNKYENSTGSSYGPALVTGTNLSILFDSDTRELEFWWNGVSQGVAYTVGVPDRGTEYVPMIHGNDSGAGAGPIQIRVNFGQQPFKYKPPEGYKTLNTKNLPVNIARPDQYVGITTWSGELSGSAGTLRHMPIGFQPDFVWIKQTNQAYSTGHQLYDSVRGAGNEKELNSSSTAIEGAGNIETYGWVNSFDSQGGFTTKGGTTDFDYVNQTGVDYVAWCWKAGGNKNTFNVDDVGYATAAAAGLDGGSLTVLGASVGTQQGFSIIKTNLPGSNIASTFSHGLNQAPDLVFVKPTATTFQWDVYNSTLGKDAYLVLNDTAAQVTSATTVWNSTAPTSSVFSLGSAWPSSVGTNQPIIAYCWHSIPGYSKFGTFEGNGDSSGTNLTWNGPFVYTGFRPALVIIKSVDSANNWNVQDDVRMSYNGKTGVVLQWDQASTESTIGTGYSRSYFADGFKITNSNHETNKPSETFMYMAWAKNPFNNLYGGQANSR